MLPLSGVYLQFQLWPRTESCFEETHIHTQCMRESSRGEARPCTPCFLGGFNYFVCLFVCIAVGIECLDHGASLRRGEVLCFLWFDPLWFSMFLPCWNEGVLRKLRYFQGNNFSWHAGYLFEIFNLKRMWATLGPKYQSHVKNYLYDRFYWRIYCLTFLHKLNIM